MPLTLTKPLGVGILGNRHKATGQVFPAAIEAMTSLNADASRSALAAGLATWRGKVAAAEASEAPDAPQATEATEAAAIAPLAATSAHAAAPKYVFFFIGDGLAMAQRSAAEYFLAAKEGKPEPGIVKLVMNKMPVQGMTTTYSLNSIITDSGAAGIQVLS